MKELGLKIAEISVAFGMSKACCLGVLLGCLEDTLSDHDKKIILVKFVCVAKKLVDQGLDLSDGCRNN